MDPNENSGKVYKGKDVDFIEFPDNNRKRDEDGIIQEEIEINPLTCKQEDETSEEENEDIEEDRRQETSEEESIECRDAEDTINDLQENRRYPLRLRKPREFPDIVTYRAICEDSSNLEPLTVKKALEGENGEK